MPSKDDLCCGRCAAILLHHTQVFINLNILTLSGCGAVGSARRLGRRCRRFEPCHSDHMKIIRTFSYLEKRSDYLFYLSIQILIARNENSLYHIFGIMSIGCGIIVINLRNNQNSLYSVNRANFQRMKRIFAQRMAGDLRRTSENMHKSSFGVS